MRRYFKKFGAANIVMGLAAVIIIGALLYKVSRVVWSVYIRPSVQVGTITAPTLKTALDQGQNILVLDIRPRVEYASGHIPTAKNIPLDELEVRAPNELNTSQKIVAYCRCLNDTRSNLAREALTDLGFNDVSVLTGGLQQWEDRHYAIIPTSKPLGD